MRMYLYHVKKTVSTNSNRGDAKIRYCHCSILLVHLIERGIN